MLHRRSPALLFLLIIFAGCDGSSAAVTDAAVADAAGSDAAGSDAALEGVLLELEIGNQISGSYLTIHDDGEVEREERTCCPPTTVPVVVDALEPLDLAELAADITEVAAAGTSQEDLGEFAQGSQVGSLVVYHGGDAHIVREYLREGTQRIRIESDATDATTAIVELVNGIVDIDIE